MPNPLEPTPNQGDVLFTDDLDLGAALSGYVQSRIDPLARNANETFEHVAIAIDDSFALEAMPAKKLIATAGAALFKAKAGSPWSGVKLEAGTRIAPLPDIFVPAWRSGTKLTVLRPTNIHTVDRSAFDTTSPDFLALIGSAYSVGSLREAAEPILPRVMTTWTASKKGLSSAPQDLATRLGINDAFRKRLAAELPNYKIPPQPETYFCSQLVAHLLKKSNLLPSTQDTPYLTPTGLHALLLRFGWKDVSASDYNSDKIKAVAFQSPARCATRYYERLAQIKLGTQILGAGEHAKMIGAILAKATSRLDEVLKRLPPAPDK